MTPRRKVLGDLEMYLAFLQCLVPVDRESDLEGFLVVPLCAVVYDYCFIGVTVVFCCAGGGEAPFDEGRAADEGDVVEVDYLMVSIIHIRTDSVGHTLNTNSNLGCFTSASNKPVISVETYPPILRDCGHVSNVI